MPGPEKDVKEEVKKLLTKHGWYYWMPPANAFGRGGISDFHALRNGVFLAIETKAGMRLTGRHAPTVLQVRFIKAIRENGGRAMVVNESNLDRLEAKLR